MTRPSAGPVARRRVLAAVTVVVCAALGLGGHVGPAAATTIRAGVPAAAPQPASITLLGQSTWVGYQKVFSLRLGLARGLPADDQIVVDAYPRLTTRTAFDLAAAGNLGQEVPEWSGYETIGEAPRYGRDGVWARVPVDALSQAGDLFTPYLFDPGDLSGVYPLRVQLLDARTGADVGATLSTFLVYDGGQSGAERLSTSVTVGVGATPMLSSGQLLPTAPTAAVSSALSRLSAALGAAPGESISLAVSPQTAQALAVGSATDRATLARLGVLVGRGDELLPEPYAPVPLASLDDEEIDQQIQEGGRVLNATLGVTPSVGTWVLDDPTDDATLQLLRQGGMRELVVPDGRLTPLPASDTVTTYGRPADLDDGVDTGTLVVGADPVLDGRATEASSPVLAAEQTLAELAMIELEEPHFAIGVAISLPSGSSVSPTYLRTLLRGLRGNPFVRTVTVAGLFARVPAQPPAANVAPGSSPSASTVPVRRLQAGTAGPVPFATTLGDVGHRIDGLAGFLPSDTSLLARLRRQYLIAPSAGLSPALRAALLDSMNSAISGALSVVHLPGDISVTLTSLKATLPLVVNSDPGSSPHVRLVLDSPKLDFRPFRPSEGTCTVTGRSVETCLLVLRAPETVLRVPVEARTSGVFSLDVSLTSPDGTLSLATARDTVRSTAVSFVGIVIIVASLLFLGIWWIRDIRSGRRPRELVARPGDDVDDDEDGGNPPGGGGHGPGPPSAPPGPPEPTVPAPRLPVTGPVTVVDPALPVGAAGHGAAGLGATVPHRGRHRPRHRRDAPTARRRMSPSGRPPGPITEPPPILSRRSKPCTESESSPTPPVTSPTSCSPSWESAWCRCTSASAPRSSWIGRS